MKLHRSENARTTGEAVAIRKRRRPAVTRAAFVLCPLLIGVLAGCPGGVRPRAAIVKAPVVTIASVTESATEGTPLEFEVSSDPAPTAALTVRITLDAAGCTLAQSLDPTVTIAAGHARATLTVQTTGVEVGADDGCTVTAAIAPGDGYEVGDTATSASATLTRGGDADPRTPQAPAVTIAAVAGSVAEGNPVSFRLTASPAPTEDLTVNVSWDQTGSFLTATGPSTVTIPTGSRTSVLSADTDDDSTDESNGSVSVSVLGGSGYTVGSPSVATVTVTDDDPGQSGSTPVVTIAAVAGSVAEGNPVSFRLTASPAPTVPLTVRVRWNQAGSFLTGTRPSTVTIPTGSRTATLSANTSDDSNDESKGSVTVIGGRGYTVGSPSAANVIVTDDDDAVTLPVVSISSITTNPVTEGNSISITMAISPPFSGNSIFAARQIVVVATTDSGRSTVIGFAVVGSSTLTMTFSVVDDDPVTTNRPVVVTVIPRANYSIGSPSSMTVPPPALLPKCPGGRTPCGRRRPDRPPPRAG